nr:hypothetical protein [Methanobrevibacter arboriphilus]
MPYDNKNPYQRVNDGVYDKYLNNGILVADNIIMNSVVKLPEMFDNNYWNTNGNDKKARWLDCTFNNGNVINNNTNIIVNDFIEFKCNIILSLFDKITQLNIDATGNFKVYWYDTNHENQKELTNNLSDLKSMLLNNHKFYLRIVKTGSDLVLNNLDLWIVTYKTSNQDNFIINPNNINGLIGLLDNHFDMLYPVGIIIEMGTNKNPNLSMRGVWEKVMKDKFTLGSGENYQLGESGGSSTHILNNDEMPNHTHLQNSHNHTQGSHNHSPSSNSDVAFLTRDGGGIGNKAFAQNGMQVYETTAKTNSVSPTINNTTATNQNTGGGGAHNNMPPYEVVNKWKRIS